MAGTWHHGVVARYWAEFNTSGPEIDYFRRFVEDGQPALDLACGTGRLLLPYLRAGLDVDGVDASPDMIALARARADGERLSTNLHVQPMHELDLPRRYRTIFICGGFGLGATRAQCDESLRRIRDHLAPGGLLVLDNEVPWADEVQWRYWPKSQRAKLPLPLREPGERRRGADGAEYELRARILEVDPLEQLQRWEMRAQMWRDGQLVADESNELTMILWFGHELSMLLERAGFIDVEVRGQYNDQPPTADDDFLVYVARNPAA